MFPNTTQSTCWVSTSSRMAFATLQVFSVVPVNNRGIVSPWSAWTLARQSSFVRLADTIFDYIITTCAKGLGMLIVCNLLWQGIRGQCLCVHVSAVTGQSVWVHVCLLWLPGIEWPRCCWEWEGVICHNIKFSSGTVEVAACKYSICQLTAQHWANKNFRQKWCPT